MSDRLSLAASPTVTGALTQPPGTPVTEVAGAVRSTLMPSTVAEAVWPALSVTLAEADRSLPSPSTTESAGQATTPDRLSAQVQWTVTSPVNQPSPFGVPRTLPVMVGAVLSTLTSGVVIEALLPAASVAVAVSAWAAPSPKVCALSCVFTPDSASDAV